LHQLQVGQVEVAPLDDVALLHIGLLTRAVLHRADGDAETTELVLVALEAAANGLMLRRIVGGPARRVCGHTAHQLVGRDGQSAPDQVCDDVEPTLDLGGGGGHGSSLMHVCDSGQLHVTVTPLPYRGVTWPFRHEESTGKDARMRTTI